MPTKQLLSIFIAFALPIVAQEAGFIIYGATPGVFCAAIATAREGA